MLTDRASVRLGSAGSATGVTLVAGTFDLISPNGGGALVGARIPL
jgi:hypothetical protein